MSGYRVPFVVGTVRGRDFQMWPTVEEPAFSNILAEGTPIPRNIVEWGAKDLSLLQLHAISSRISEWQFSGGWSSSADYYSEPGHVYQMTMTTVQTFVNSPVSKAVFAKSQNDLTTWTIPIVKEPHLLFQNFGPHIAPHKDYQHDFDQPSIGGGYHSYGIVTSDASGPFAAILIHTVIDDGTGPRSASDGNFQIRMFRDYLTSFLFGNSRGVDMVRFKPLGVSGPSGPVDGFDVYCVLNGVNSSTFEYSYLDTYTASPNGVITFDPVIAPTFTVPVQIGPIIGPSTSAVLTSVGCDIVIRATKFFPYANSNGDPVFDETSGAQINDPFI